MAKKLFYKIGEACKKVDVQPYVLRYWETEFELLSPDKSKSGQRVYTDDDLAVIRRIKELLYDEGYTTVGAKKKLQAELEDGELGSTSASKSSKSGPSKKTAKKSKPASGSKQTKPTAGSKSAPDDDPPEAESEAETKKTARADAPDDARLAELEDGLRTALRQAREILDRLA